jgi:pSer/pThr/pTyr-binding forkhead associated (FHA) protein
MNDQFRSPVGAPTTTSDTSATLRPLGAGETFTLTVARPLRLGRSSDDPGISRMLAAFPDVSTEHASVTLHKGGSVEITDLESRNGTWVRGERLASGRSCRVRLPVELRLGEDCFLTLVEGSVPTAAAPQ